MASNGTIILDGGMGQELAARGLETSDGLWSARALVTAPDDVMAVHRDFIDAGADVITTNTYASTRRRLDPVDEGAFERLNRRAGELANRAREESGREVRIAGSLPPLHGSYRPDRVRPVEELEPLYREQAELLTEFVDLFLCETMSTAGEARAAAKAAAEFDKPVWVSWTLADDRSGRLRSGESIVDAAQALEDLGVSALLVNCSIPEAATAAMPALARAAAGRPYGAYPNGFHPIDSAVGVNDGADVPGEREDLDQAGFARFAQTWREAGAQLIGGCCETHPSHIAELSRVLHTAAAA
jgi:S-methylmethionine-dependent homocysteine/selenocysteine methylase